MDLRTLVDLSLLFIAYYLVERCIRLAIQAQFPAFFDHLLESGKLRALTAFCMGLLITLFSTPSCAHTCIVAIMDRSTKPSWTATMCLTSRVVLLVAELNRLDYDDVYVVHHIGALLAGWFIITFQISIHSLLVIFMSLIVEIFGDTIWILSAYAASCESPPPELMRFRQVLAKLNVIQYAIVRTLGIGVSVWLSLTDTDFQHHATWEHLVAWILGLAHAAFCIWYINRHSRNAWASGTTPGTRIFTINVSHKPPHIRVHTSNFYMGPDIIFTLYGVFMGLGFALLYIVVLFLVPGPEVFSALPIIQLSAILGARVASLIFEDGIPAFLQSPVATFLRPGFWLHGGIAGAIMGMYYCYARHMIVDFWRFSGAMCIALPLYETASRIGCHFYGCCFGRPLSLVEVKQSRITWLHLWPVTYHSSSHVHAGKALFPVQLYSAIHFFLLFSFSVVLLAYYMSIPFAGFLTLSIHACIRLHTEKYRADYRGPVSWSLSTTGKLAVGQAIIGIVGAGVFSGCATAVVREQSADAPLFVRHDTLGVDVLRAVSVAFGVGFVIYGVHRGEIGMGIVKSDEKNKNI